MQKLPLTGIRVADFCQVRAGAHSTQWLGVMGAEVIKIEPQLRPDLPRIAFVPGRPDLSEGLNQGNGFAYLNYGKNSITLNMNKPEAKEIPASPYLPFLFLSQDPFKFPGFVARMLNSPDDPGQVSLAQIIFHIGLSRCKTDVCPGNSFHSG